MGIRLSKREMIFQEFTPGLYKSDTSVPVGVRWAKLQDPGNLSLLVSVIHFFGLFALFLAVIFNFGDVGR